MMQAVSMHGTRLACLPRSERENADMAPTSYSDVLARNIRAARSRADLTQEDLGARMRALGHAAWLYQTVGNVERGRRRVTAEEVAALALALDTTIPALAAPSDQDGDIEMPSGVKMGAVSLQRLAYGVNDHAVQWGDSNSPTVSAFRQVPGASVLERGMQLDQGYQDWLAERQRGDGGQ